MSPVTLDAVMLGTHALAVIEREAAIASAEIETGGILLGQWSETSIRIIAAGGPGPKAVQQPRFFPRDLEHARQLAEEAWLQHGAQWVGEWHTHPRTGLAPSEFDLNTYREHLRDDELGFDVFISVIARATRSGTRLVAWAVNSTTIERIPIQHWA